MPPFDILKCSGPSFPVGFSTSRIWRLTLSVMVFPPCARHCERKRSNPEATKQGLDCFVASAPRNGGLVKPWHASEGCCAPFKTCDNPSRRKRGGVANVQQVYAVHPDRNGARDCDAHG